MSPKQDCKRFFSRLSEIFQSGAKVIILETSKAAGERVVKETSKAIKGDNQLLLKTTVQRFTDAGLGKIEVVEFDLEEAEVKFRIWNNFSLKFKRKKQHSETV